MNKICTNPKNYKLTQGKVYEILDEEDGYYLLINDSNKTVRYYSDLFTDVEEAVQEVAPPPPPARTEADVINSLIVTYSDRRCNVTYLDLENNTVSFTTNQISVNDTHISCGIKQLYNINNVLESIEANIDTSSSDFIDLKKQIIKQVISRFISNLISSSRWMLMSTNFETDFEDYYEIFDSLSQTNLGWEENNNSGSNIKLWVFNSDNF